MWWLSRIRPRPVPTGTELERAARQRDDAQAEARRKNAIKVERAKARCTAQLAFLDELRPWANRCQMWFSDNDRKVPRFGVGPIYRDRRSYTLYYYEDGVVEAFWHATDKSAGWLVSDDVRLWELLLRISTTDLLAAANEAGWLRGAGSRRTAG